MWVADTGRCRGVVQAGDTALVRDVKDDVAELSTQAKKVQSAFEELFLVLRLGEGLVLSGTSLGTRLYVCDGYGMCRTVRLVMCACLLLSCGTGLTVCLARALVHPVSDTVPTTSMLPLTVVETIMYIEKSFGGAVNIALYLAAGTPEVVVWDGANLRLALTLVLSTAAKFCSGGASRSRDVVVHVYHNGTSVWFDVSPGPVWR